jgi:hypothetical protein
MSPLRALAHSLFATVAACGGSDDAITPAPGASGPYFAEPMFFNEDVSHAAVSATSATQIAAIRAAGGWGNGDRMQIDFSLDVLEAPAGTAMHTFTPTADFLAPDCDHVPMPVPTNGNLEGESGYACTEGGDCHLLVFDPAARKLYEMFGADLTSRFHGGCLVVWDLAFAYTEVLRGDQCTSADAAGFPIAPLLFTADEVAAGEIAHAIRFILPPSRIRPGFVRPATHATVSDGADDAPSFGVHLRLRADYPLENLPSDRARVVARALQKYGMYHADNGNIALNAQSDRHTAATWDGLLDASDLDELAVEDFEVIDHGDSFRLTATCRR